MMDEISKLRGHDESSKIITSVRTNDVANECIFAFFLFISSNAKQHS